MHKFFCQGTDISGDKIIISDKGQLHHIKNVLRLKPGKQMEVFDESGNEYNCEICEVKDRICLDIKNKIPADKTDQKIKLTVACAIPKKAKIDDIIDKLVQLGVERIIPLKTERVIVKLDKHKEAERLERWKKIALSASKQSKRNDLAIIEPIQDFQKVILRSSEFDLRVIPHLEGKRQSLKHVLDKFIRGNPTFSDNRRGGLNLPYRLNKDLAIIVLIGPEGDFSANEVNSAIAAGFIPVSLGDLVLRVDTAAIAVASSIKLFLS